MSQPSPLPANDTSQSDALKGFHLARSVESDRLLQLIFPRETVEAFLEAVAEWPMQALAYKSFLRFRVAKTLDDLCGNTLQPVLVNTMVDRDTGASW